MSIAKAVFSGTVFREPEKRFTRNNVPVTSFTLKVDDPGEVLLRVISKGKLAENVENSIRKSDRIVAEGALETDSAQDEDGNEKRFVQLQLNSFEVLSGGSSLSPKSDVKYAEDDFSDELIDNEEIPF